jgi:hypothetical protein
MKVITAVAIMALFIIIGGSSFIAGYEYHQPREVIVYKWLPQEVVKVDVPVLIPYLPDDYVEVAIRGLDQAIYSHQYYIDNEDVSEGSIAWHLRTIDKYKVSIQALKGMMLRKEMERVE